MHHTVATPIAALVATTAKALSRARTGVNSTRTLTTLMQTAIVFFPPNLPDNHPPGIWDMMYP